jgi:hypothetical protein
MRITADPDMTFAKMDKPKIIRFEALDILKMTQMTG